MRHTSTAVFACHSASCRPPRSGGTGGSLKAGAQGGSPPSSDRAGLASMVQIRKMFGLSSHEHGHQTTADPAQAIEMKVKVNKELSAALLSHPEGARLIDEMLSDDFAENGGASKRSNLFAAVMGRAADMEHLIADRRSVSFGKALNAAITHASDPKSRFNLRARMILSESGVSITPGKSPPTAREIAAHIVTRALIDGWARSATGTASMASQDAMAEDHLGTGMDRKFAATVGNVNYQSSAWSLGMAKVFNDIEYAHTQKFLKETFGPDVSTVRLYRGTQNQISNDVVLGDRVQISMNPLSSWSTNHSVARAFGRVVVMDVPIEMIQSTPLSGRGCLLEYEFILRGFPSTAEVG